MQVIPFPNGGCAVHKIVLEGDGTNHYSAWFNKAGELLDCERFPGPGTSPRVVKSADIKRALTVAVAPHLPKEGPKP